MCADYNSFFDFIRETEPGERKPIKSALFFPTYGNVSTFQGPTIDASKHLGTATPSRTIVEYGGQILTAFIKPQGFDHYDPNKTFPGLHGPVLVVYES